MKIATIARSLIIATLMTGLSYSGLSILGLTSGWNFGERITFVLVNVIACASVGLVIGWINKQINPTVFK